MKRKSWSELDHTGRAFRLQRAIGKMADRYGLACMDQAFARPGTDKHDRASRTADRRYRALLRLTGVLTLMALEVTR